MKKIIILDHQDLTVGRKSYLKIDEFRAAGFHVEHWDIHLLLNNRVFYDVIEDDFAKKILDYNQFRLAIGKENNHEVIYISFIARTRSTINIIKVLHENNCFCVTHTVGISGYIFNKYLNISYVWNKMLHLRSNVITWLYYIFHRIPRQHNCIISAGNYTKNIDIHINHTDWDTCKVIEGKNRSVVIPNNRYFVFLDIYFPAHPDFIGQKRIIKPSEEIYQKNMNVFFDKIERDLGVDIVVAAHPKANYEDNTFCGRRIIKYNTAELVRYSEAVITHHSSSISFAVIYDKPLLFITDSETVINKSVENDILVCADVLNKNVYRVEDIGNVTLDIFQKIEKKSRAKFIYSILTSPETENKKSIDIMIEEFKRL